jgi:hypothetical protein
VNKLLVPTLDTNQTFISGALSSFVDAPGGVRRQMK